MVNYVTVVCPKCGSEMYANKANSTCECPNCGEKFSIIENLDENKVDNVTKKQKKSVQDINKQLIENIAKKPFYTKTWFIILMLFIFFPIGIYLMWKYRKFPSFVRIIIVIIFSFIIVDIFTGSNFIVKNGIINSVNEISYNNIKKELGISKELKNEFSPMSNYIHYFGNYKFKIPSYFNQKGNVFSLSEDDGKVVSLKITKIRNSEANATFEILNEETKQGRMLKKLKSVFGDIEILNYQTINNFAVKGIIYRFIDTNKKNYYEQFVFGDKETGDWYYLNFQENVDMEYEYNEDFMSICKSIDKNKNIMLIKSSTDYIGKNYKEVVSDLERQGFKNIVIKPNYDLVFGWLVSENELDKVSINGNKSFNKGDVFKENAEVIVTYHAFSSNETIDEKKKK